MTFGTAPRRKSVVNSGRHCQMAVDSKCRTSSSDSLSIVESSAKTSVRYRSPWSLGPTRTATNPPPSLEDARDIGPFAVPPVVPADAPGDAFDQDDLPPRRSPARHFVLRSCMAALARSCDVRRPAPACQNRIRHHPIRAIIFYQIDRCGLRLSHVVFTLVDAAETARPHRQEAVL